MQILIAISVWSRLCSRVRADRRDLTDDGDSSLIVAPLAHKALNVTNGSFSSFSSLQKTGEGVPVTGLFDTPFSGQEHDGDAAMPPTDGIPANCLFLVVQAYESAAIREFAGTRGAWANIPLKDSRRIPFCFSSNLYRDRNHVERLFHRSGHRRRVATRYDKMAANVLAFIKFAAIRLWSRVYESTSYCRHSVTEHEDPAGKTVIA